MTSPVPAAKSAREWRRLLQTEADQAFLYHQIAELEEDPAMAAVFQRLAGTEEQHLQQLQDRIRRLGQEPPTVQPSTQARTKVWLAKRFGAGFILPTLIEAENAVSRAIVGEKKRRGQTPGGGEFAHGNLLQALGKLGGGMSGRNILRLEGKHRSLGGNALRAAVLGANDGLVSNLSLVMGVAGAVVDDRAILITGLAGLLAGAISMALGEWLSVQSSRELFQRQLAIETEELEADPEEEIHELALIYQAKGVSHEEAQRMARGIIENREIAVETLAREELGMDPEELGGSAWEAALVSFFLFAVGAVIPVASFFFLQGQAAVLASIGFSTIGLFIIGAAITLLTGRNLLFSGFRQVLFGLMAAAVTFGIGHLIGVSLAG